jgi:hypothetical protein
MGIYERASLTSKEPVVKLVQRHKHKISANTQKQSTKQTKLKQCGRKKQYKYKSNNNNNNNNTLPNSFFFLFNLQ